MNNKHLGFSLLEVMLAITIIGLLAALAAPRLSDIQSSTQARGYVDDLLSAMRYAQKVAISTQCDTQVLASNNGYEINRWRTVSGQLNCQPSNHNDPTERLQHPATAEPMQAVPGNGVAITGTFAFYFDKQGQPKDTNSSNLLTAPTTMTIADHTITLEPFTGFVHAP